MEKVFLWVLFTILFLYIGVCTVLYFMQGWLLFPASSLPSGYVFRLPGRFEEKIIMASDGTALHGLLFKADSSKGLVFYLHGNGGNVNQWGRMAQVYTDLHYDVFFLDYRGYGKSAGHMSNEAQLLSDVKTAYDSIKLLYPEQNIVILGYSIGTGPAAYLASVGHPRLLILQAPYFSVKDLIRQHMPLIQPILPSFIVKYPLKTWSYVARTTAPIVIFHGNKDSVITVDQSYQLRTLLKPGDRLIVLDGQGHDGITENREYLEALKEILDPQ